LSWSAVQLAGFEVTTTGRFWGDHRGQRRLLRPSHSRRPMRARPQMRSSEAIPSV